MFVARRKLPSTIKGQIDEACGDGTLEPTVSELFEEPRREDAETSLFVELFSLHEQLTGNTGNSEDGSFSNSRNTAQHIVTQHRIS
jgi:hypothetical protein